MKKGWKIISIGDVCDKGSSNVSQNQLNDNEGEFPIFGASGLIKNVNFYHNEKPYLSIVKDGSGVGRVTKMDAFTSVIGTLQYVFPKENIDLDYLYYSLISVDFKKYVAGAAIPHIYFKDYKNEPFLWMPLPEQQKIVALLDKCFQSIDRAKTIAEKNLQNAKELFESYLNEVFEKEYLKKIEFSEVCTLIGGSQPSKDNFVYEPKDGYIRLIQVRDYRTEKFKTYIPKNLAKRFCDKNDIMIGRYGPPIFGIFRGLEGAYNVALMKAEVKDSLCYKDYFFWYLQNKNIIEFVELSSKRAAGQDGVRKELLEKYPISLPTLKEQKIIVDNLQELKIKTENLKATYKNKIEYLEELKKSILQKAFNGELNTEITL